MTVKVSKELLFQITIKTSFCNSHIQKNSVSAKKYYFHQYVTSWVCF